VREEIVDKKATINVHDLRIILNKIFTHITDDLKIDEIELIKNYYWEVPEDCLYSLEKDPSDFTSGSLVDDLDFLKPLLSDEDQAISLMLIHVAPLLRYIATKVGQ
jgi:hypothetical protein